MVSDPCWDPGHREYRRRMPTRRPIPLAFVALTLLVIGGLAAAACSSSSSSSSSTPAGFTKGVTAFFTPEDGKAPSLPASFVDCIYAKVPAGDRTSVSKLTASSSSDSLADASGVRLTRAANQCDAALTKTLIETSAFAGAPASITASQKSCATTKIISTLSGLDDSKLSGSNTSTVQTAVQKALTSCGVSLNG
jgi:hypothetical protein